MNKQDFYIIGGTVLALGLIYYFFIYKPKPKTETKTTKDSTQYNNTTYDPNSSTMSSGLGAMADNSTMSSGGLAG